VKKKGLLVFLIIFGSLFQLSTVFRSGGHCQLGICFWGPNSHDGVWHLSLINQTLRHIPPRMPTFAGGVIKNYHWGYNLLAGLVSKTLPFSVADVHFRVLPFLFTLLLGYLSFKLGILITKSFWVGFWFVFLNYFAGSLGWLATLARNGVVGGESLFWSMQSSSFLLNPPYAMSVIFLLIGIILLKKWEKNLSYFKIILLGLIFGLLINIKAYSAVLFFLSLATSLLIFRKTDREKGLIGLVSLMISAVVWLLWQKQGKSPFIFEPLWFIRTMFEAQDRLFAPRLGQVWWALKDNWLVSPRFWILASGGIVIFLLGNFGTRLAGLVKFKKSFWDLFFTGFIFWGVLIPTVFVQKGTAWNTIQFLYYGLFFSNWFLAKLLASLTRREAKSLLVLSFLVLPILPTNWSVFKNYFTLKPSAYISQKELEGLELLSRKEDGFVLTYPYNPFAKKGKEPPLPLYLYETTAYVSAFSGKQVFLEDEMNLEITGFPWRERRAEAEKFFSSRDRVWARGFLLNNRIDYIYLVNDQRFSLEEGDLGVKMIFNNGQVRIYQVER